MAEEENDQPKESAAGKGFGMKLGPLKVWQWGVIVIGGVVGIVIVRRLMGGSSAVGSATTAIPDTGGMTSSAPAASTQDFAAAIANLSDSVKKQFAAQADALSKLGTQEQSDVQALNASETAQGSALATALQNTSQVLGGQLNTVYLTAGKAYGAALNSPESFASVRQQVATTGIPTTPGANTPVKPLT